MNKTVEGEQYYVDVLSGIEGALNQSGIDHRFVGGVIAGPINPDTSIKVDVSKRVATLANHSPISLLRSDKSVRDIDLIAFSPLQGGFAEAERLLAEQEAIFSAKDFPYPPISIEPTHYPCWPKRKRLLQFVSTLDVDEEFRLHLTFGNVDQATPWHTVEPWTMVFQNGLALQTINPYGLKKRYEMRNASGIKWKDRQPEFESSGKKYSKIDLLDRAENEVGIQGLEQGVDFQERFKTWDEFIYNLKHNPDPLTRVKGLITKGYWNTIGTAFAHGTGMLAPFAKLGSKFTG